MRRLAIDEKTEVQAIINGDKTEIREPVIWPTRKWEFVKPVNDPSSHKTDESGVSRRVRMTGVYAVFSDGISDNHIVVRCPYQTGEILCLSQEWRKVVGTTDTYLDGEIIDCSEPHIGYEFKIGGYYFPDGWKPIEDEFHLSSIVPLIRKGKWQKARFMPKKIAQIFLRVTGVTVSRLQSLSQNSWAFVTRFERISAEETLVAKEKS